MNRIATSALAALALTGAATAQNLVQNGDFTNANDWTVSWSDTGDTYLETGNQAGYGDTGFTPGSVVELHANVADQITQTVTVTKSGDYYLSFLSAARDVTLDYGRPDWNNFGVSLIAGSSTANAQITNFLGPIVTPTSTTASLTTYHEYLTAGTYQLSFTSFANDYAGSYQDSLGGIVSNVSLAAPSPAPALAFGLGGLAIFCRRARRKSYAA